MVRDGAVAGGDCGGIGSEGCSRCATAVRALGAALALALGALTAPAFALLALDPRLECGAGEA